MKTALNPRLKSMFALVALCLVGGAEARAQTAGASDLVSVTEKAFKIYAADTGVDPTTSSDRFVGFRTSVGATAVMVETFSAEGEFELWSQSYSCQSSGENEASSCERADGYPRCFYYSRAGAYSLDDHTRAVRAALALVSARTGILRTDSLKAWQSDEYIYVRVVYLAESGVQRLTDANLGCWYRHSELVCEFLSETGPNEP